MNNTNEQTVSGLELFFVERLSKISDQVEKDDLSDCFSLVLEISSLESILSRMSLRREITPNVIHQTLAITSNLIIRLSNSEHSSRNSLYIKQIMPRIAFINLVMNGINLLYKGNLAGAVRLVKIIKSAHVGYSSLLNTEQRLLYSFFVKKLLDTANRTEGLRPIEGLSANSYADWSVVLEGEDNWPDELRRYHLDKDLLIA